MENKIKVSGIVMTEPVVEEKFGGESIYGIELGIKKPKKDDYYNIFLRVSDRFDCFSKIKTGVPIEVTGSLRSTNKREGSSESNIKRLVVSIFCSTVKILDSFEESVNEGEVSGVITNTPYFGEATDKMPQRCDVMLKIERAHNKSTYLPVTFRGRNAEFISHKEKGTELKCSGRIQSRQYRKMIKGNMETIRVTEFVAREVDVVGVSEE